MSKYGHRTINWFEAIINKLGGEAQAEKFLRGELTVSKSARYWREENGIVYFSVTSDGTAGEEWIARFESKGFLMGGYAKQALRSSNFKPTSGVTTEIAVLNSILFEDDDRITKKIRAEANRRKLTEPNAEVACLIRDKFTGKKIEVMGFRRIVVMHEPIIMDSIIDQSLLSLDRGGYGCGLYACCGNPDNRWDRGDGFAFAIS